MNQQKPERLLNDNNYLEIHSIFKTIQGEGPFAGTPAVFIRLAGCNLQCPGCDTDYTSKRVRLEPQRIVERVKELAGAAIRLVVITGGEPFRQNIQSLFKELFERYDFYVQIETNGTLHPGLYSYSFNTFERLGVYIVCSPKTTKIHPNIRKHACAFKYVINADYVDKNDGLPTLALGHPVLGKVARMTDARLTRLLYVQPFDSGDVLENKRHLQAAIDSCMKFGHILQLQIHKIIGLE